MSCPNVPSLSRQVPVYLSLQINSHSLSIFYLWQSAILYCVPDLTVLSAEQTLTLFFVCETWSHYVDQAILKLTYLSDSDSPVLGLKAYIHHHTKLLFH